MVEGRRAGQVVPVEVVEVEGKPVATATAQAYLAMQAAAAREGVQLRISSAWRTNCEQTRIHAEYLGGTGPFAFPPGYSRHQDGAALDLLVDDPRVLAWLERNAGRFGFAQTIPGENWHWEFSGRSAGSVTGDGAFACPPGRTRDSSGFCQLDPCAAGLVRDGRTGQCVAAPQDVQESVPLGAKVALGLGVLAVGGLVVWSMAKR